MQLIPTILCGGAGSRLWPVSRELHPKPFIRLSDGESLLQKTFLRAAQLPLVTEIVTVTNRELFFKTRDEFRETQFSELKQSFILEPFGRNTAAAVVMAALRIAALYGDEACMLVLPADHLISDQLAFAEAVAEALPLAKANQLVTFGIKPEHPETGYGYIEALGNQVLSFTEKPSLRKAEEFIAKGSFFWNAGLFCFKAGALLVAMAEHAGDILQAAKSCFDQSSLAEGKQFSQLELDAESFALVPENSLDYALIEKAQTVTMVPCQMGWSDIGSWNALGALTKADEQGNRIEGEAFLHEVADCYIQSKERLVAAVGLNNLFIIDTPDALLVANKSHAQEVKAIYQRLRDEEHEAHKLHRTVHRPWGTYTILQEGERFKIKQIEVRPGASLSLQMHYHRSEHWIVVSGIAKIVNGEEEKYISTNESTYVPAGRKHRLENPGLTTLVMIEVQCGEYLGEDDIVRFDDIYGRV